jgi:hypothetical protein
MPRTVSKETFWSKVEVTQPDACWLWLGATYSKGYGQTTWKGKDQRAHRVAWELTNGEIPEGLLVLHHCDVPACVNPRHLFLGTHADNRADCVAKGRQAKGVRSGTYLHPEKLARGASNGAYTHPERLARGERHGSAKLTEAQVQEIRASGQPQRALAVKYGVSRCLIWKIKTHRLWRPFNG